MDEWEDSPPLWESPRSPDVDHQPVPSYATTSGRGGPVVYDQEGLSQEQQIILENLQR